MGFTNIPFFDCYFAVSFAVPFLRRMFLVLFQPIHLDFKLDYNDKKPEDCKKTIQNQTLKYWCLTQL